MCSCRRRLFVPKPVALRSSPIVTGVVVPGCYAAPLGDCLPPISGEHPLSRTVLEYLSSSKKMIGVSNHPWQTDKNKTRYIGISAATVKTLCKRHNSDLDPLDKFARKFVETYSDVISDAPSVEGGDVHCLFNGFDLERWMLKILCGVTHDQYLQGSGSLERWRVPAAWLRIIFAAHRFPPGCGLYVPAAPIRRPIEEFSIYTRVIYGNQLPRTAGDEPIIDPRGSLTIGGLELTIFGLQLMLLMHPPLASPNLFYRTRMFRFPEPTGRRAAFIHLGWEEAPPVFRGKTVARDPNAIGQLVIDAARMRKARQLPNRKA
jgi:hypothetical protein